MKEEMLSMFLIKRLMNRLVLSVVLLSSVFCIFACERRDLRDQEYDELFAQIKKVILDDASWENNFVYLSENGLLMITEDTQNDEIDESLLGEMTQFHTLLTNLFGDESSIVTGNGYYVSGVGNLLFVSVNDESSNIVSFNLIRYNETDIQINPVYKDGEENKVLGIIFKVDLEKLYSNQYGSMYNSAE